MVRDATKLGEFVQDDAARVPYSASEPVKRLRALLKKHRLPQVRAAALLGVDQRTVRRWLAPPKSPGWRSCPAWVPVILEVQIRAASGKRRARRR